MAQITSREELERWFKQHDRADFAQVIAVRAVLRELPYAFSTRVPQKTVVDVALPSFRAISISWAARNFPAHDMASAASASATYGSVSIRAVLYVASATASGYASIVFDSAASAVEYAARASADASAVWTNINRDCAWLVAEEDIASAACRLTREPLWPAGEPGGWREAWEYAAVRLHDFNQGYSVWIDWHNRRINGEDAAFDIPGDTDRIEDKAILARLADATDEGFWDKGATYVNTTLQNWIDEARARVALPNFDVFSARALTGAVPDFASNETLYRRADLEQKIAALNDELARLEPTPAPIGHNRPPLDLDDAEIDDIPLVIQEVRVQSIALAEEIKPPLPNLQTTLATVSRLHKISSWLAKKADLFVNKAVEKAGELTGAGTVAFFLLQLPQVQAALVAVLKSAEKWLQTALSML
jgi:hypothetical protein